MKEKSRNSSKRSKGHPPGNPVTFEHDPRIIELVKFLARISAERDYKAQMKKKKI